MAAYPIFYSFRRCPYAMRARMAIMKAKITCEIREVVLRDKPQEMLVLSQKGTVPVLELSDGTVLDESYDVMRWALTQADPDGWLNVDQKQSHQLILENDFDFKEKLDRYKYFERYPECSQEDYRIQAEGFLSKLETLLGETEGGGLMKRQITLADVAIFPFIRQFARVDWEWFCQSSYVRVKNWISDFEEGELFLSIMNKYPPWHKHAPVTLFA